jgi:inositol-phosphate transport system permease protein
MNTENAPGRDIDWTALATKARWYRRINYTLLLSFLTLVSVPIILPYLWMVMIALTAKTGGVRSDTLWSAVTILVPAIVLLSAVHLIIPARKHNTLKRAFGFSLVSIIATWLFYKNVVPDIHFDNFRFLWIQDFVSELEGRGSSGAGAQFPSVWDAFRNSLIIASAQTVLVTVMSTMAAYYISRFSFPGRRGYLRGMLVLQAFPAMTLIIPIFLICYWVGLSNSLIGPMLVLTAMELPFFIFIMKGFFDAVPWDIEMAAVVDGASRRQAFWQVVLPQVWTGMVAVAVFAFIKGWEDYVIVSALRTGGGYWVMSFFLDFVAEDIMGVDYGIVAAVAVFYLLPGLLLYVFCQRFLTQMNVGGVKG